MARLIRKDVIRRRAWQIGIIATPILLFAAAMNEDTVGTVVAGVSAAIIIVVGGLLLVAAPFMT